MQMDQIGKGISARRKQLGMSQEELARRIGVTRQAVSRWESSAALPSVDNMIDLSQALQISVDELLRLTPPSNDTGISAQTVGLLLDEHSARQEKRINGLTIALIFAAVLLAGGILLSALLFFSQTSRIEESLNARIASTNNALASAISSLDARIGSTIQQAVSDGSTRLTDSKYTIIYDHSSRAFVMTLQAWPQVLSEYTDAQFTLSLNNGAHLTADAQMSNGCFLGSISIPDVGQECISGSAYIRWIENGETVTEHMKIYDHWTYFDRLVITQIGLNSRKSAGAAFAVQPYAEVYFSAEVAELRPVHIRYEIYAGEEMLAAVEESWPVQHVRSNENYRRDTAAEWIPLPGVNTREGLFLRVTISDAGGHEFTKECTIEY